MQICNLKTCKSFASNYIASQIFKQMKKKTIVKLFLSFVQYNDENDMPPLKSVIQYYNDENGMPPLKSVIQY